MRLPGFKPGGAQPLQTVSPGAYGAQADAARAIGGAVAGLAQTVGSNRRAAQNEERQRQQQEDLHAAKQAGFEMRRGNAELTQFLEETPRLDPDQHADVLDGIDINNYARQPDGTILTSDVAGDIFARRSQDGLSYLSENLREGKIKESWIAAQHAGIAEDTSTIKANTAKIARGERRTQTLQTIQEATQEQRWDEVAHQIRMGDFSDSKKAELRREASRNRTFADVDNAIQTRSIPEIDKQIELLDVPETEYTGDVDTGERNRLVNVLRGLKKKLAAGAQATATADMKTAFDRIIQMNDSYTSGGQVNALQLGQTIDQLSAVTGITVDALKRGDVDLSLYNITERRQIQTVQDTIRDVEFIEDLSWQDEAGRDEIMAERLRAAENDADAALQVDRLADHEARITKRINDDPIGHGQQVGLFPADVPFDPNNIQGTLPAQLRMGAAAAAHFGVPNALVSDAALAQLQTRYQNADLDGQAAMIAEVNSVLGGGAAQEEFWKKMDTGSDSTYLAGVLSDAGPDATPTEQKAAWETSSLILQGAAALNDANNKPLLETRGWDNDARKKFKLSHAEDAALRYNDSGARLQTMEQVATALILNGADRKEAEKEAALRVLQEPLQNAGSRKHGVTAPVVNMTQRDFNVRQVNIPNRYYDSIGTIEANLQEQIAYGDVVFKDTGENRGEYYLLRVADSKYIEAHVGGRRQAAVVQWQDAMTFEPDTTMPAGLWDRVKYGREGGAERKSLALDQKDAYAAKLAERREQRNAKALEAANRRSDKVKAREQRIQDNRDARGPKF